MSACVCVRVWVCAFMSPHSGTRRLDESSSRRPRGSVPLGVLFSRVAATCTCPLLGVWAQVRRGEGFGRDFSAVRVSRSLRAC